MTNTEPKEARVKVCQSEEVLYKKGILFPIIYLEIPILIGIGFISVFYKLQGISLIVFLFLVFAGMYIFIAQAQSRNSVMITNDSIKMYFRKFDKDKEGHKDELLLRVKKPQEIKFIYPTRYEFTNIIRKGFLLGTTDGQVGEILDHTHNIEKFKNALKVALGDEWIKVFDGEKCITSQEEYFNTLKTELVSSRRRGSLILGCGHLFHKKS